MKKLLTILCILIATIAKAQGPPWQQPIGAPNITVKVKGGLVIDSLFWMPIRDTNYTPPVEGATTYSPTLKKYFGFYNSHWNVINQTITIPGIDDVLAIGQGLAADRGVDIGSHALRINSSTDGAIFSNKLTISGGDNTEIANFGNAGYIKSQNTGGTQYGVVAIDKTQVAFGQTEGKYTFTNVPTTTDTTNFKPFVIDVNSPFEIKRMTYWPTGSGGAGTITGGGGFSPLFTNAVSGGNTITFTAINQSSNLVYAGPASGSAAAPTFRGLTIADLPVGIPNANLANSNIGVSIGSSGTSPNWSASSINLGGTAILNLPTASATNTGILSAGDWITFNGKVTSVNGLTGVVVYKNADSIKKLPVDTTTNRNGYVLTFDSTNHKWYLSLGGGGGGGSMSIGAIDGNGASANGLSVSGSTLYAQSASVSAPGMVNNTTQSFSGNKTLTGSLNLTGLSNKSWASTDSVLIRDPAGKVWTEVAPFLQITAGKISGRFAATNGTMQEITPTSPIILNSGTGALGIDTTILHTYNFYNATYVALAGSYVNPSWLVSIPFSKVTSVPNSYFRNGLQAFNDTTVYLGGNPLIQNTHISGSGNFDLYLDSLTLNFVSSHNGVGINQTFNNKFQGFYNNFYVGDSISNYLRIGNAMHYTGATYVDHSSAGIVIQTDTFTQDGYVLFHPSFRGGTSDLGIGMTSKFASASTRLTIGKMPSQSFFNGSLFTQWDSVGRIWLGARYNTAFILASDTTYKVLGVNAVTGEVKAMYWNGFGTGGGGGSGVTVIGPLDGQAPSTNGAVISGVTLYMQSGDATHAGLINTVSQTIAGAKSFTAAPAFTTLLINGGIFYGDGSGVLHQTASGTTNTVLHGGSSPTYASVSLSTDVVGILPVGGGGNGTGSPALTQGAGITITGSWPNYTIANSALGTVTSVNVSGSTTGLTFTGGPVTTSGTISAGGTLVPANGGTGGSSWSPYGVIAAGSTSTGTFQQVSGTGTIGQVLTSNGPGFLPSWQAAGGGGGGISADVVTTITAGTASTVPDGTNIIRFNNTSPLTYTLTLPTNWHNSNNLKIVFTSNGTITNGNAMVTLTVVNGAGQTLSQAINPNGNTFNAGETLEYHLISSSVDQRTD